MHDHTRLGPFQSSVVSYPTRGDGGRNSWRGNTGPGLVEQFLLTWHVDGRGGLDTHALVCDPMKGSDTTGDVCRRLGVPYAGFDLHEGFDAARNDLLTALHGRKAKSIFVHPPYLGMVHYSGNQWGAAADPADLSHCDTDDNTFHEMLQAIIQNVARAVQPGGHYGLLVGNWRKSGRYYHMGSRVITLAPDDLAMEIVKIQNNVSSQSTAYSGRFVPTLHESLLVFRRGDDSIFAIAGATLERLHRFQQMTWRNVLVGAMRSGEAVTPKALLERLETHPRAQGNHVYAKIRQTLRTYPDTFARVARGKYVVV